MANPAHSQRSSSLPAGAAEERRAAMPTIVLADLETEVERELVMTWSRANHPGAEVVPAGDSGLIDRLSEGEALVVPVCVTWLPREREGERQIRLSDLAVLRDPRRPWSWMQRRIAEREPSRVRVTAGEPATTTELRRRCRLETGDIDDLVSFVRRQAAVACDRAERQIIGDRYKVPHLVSEQILASARFRGQLEELAQQLDRPFEDVLADARGCLDEVATVQSRLGIDAFRAILRPMHAKAWDIHADPEGVRQLKDLNRRHALVFLPTHRSYVDPLVLADVLHEHDLPRNHLIGGDNMAFWPIGPVGKRAGVVFIRRSFGDDAVYKLAVREFLGHLVAKRFNLEWYIEGGRSRTGKLRPPRLGLLHYITAAIEDGRAEDVLLIPTSIQYDRLHEVASMTAEQTGAVKRSEGLRWMRDYIKAQAVNVGAARVHFGEPVSLRESMQETGASAISLDKIAFKVCDGINRVTPVTATSLVTLALLGSRDRALTFDQVARLTAPLLDYVERRGIPGPIRELRKSGGLRHGLDGLVDAGVASCFEGGSEPVWSIAPGGHHIAAFYRNGALHHLVNRAIVELALLHAARLAGDPDADLLELAWQDALATRDLLKFEFFFAEKDEFREQMRVEIELIDPDWAQRIRTGGSAAELLLQTGSQPLLIAHRALRSFLDAQWIVASYLASIDPRTAIDKAQVIKTLLGVGRQHVLQGHVYGDESVSSELFAPALKAAANRDVLDPGREDVHAARVVWLEQIGEVISRLQMIDELERELRAGVLAE
jgi:glycerol-3-phosphate O-acyltransferase